MSYSITPGQSCQGKSAPFGEKTAVPRRLSSIGPARPSPGHSPGPFPREGGQPGQQDRPDHPPVHAPRPRCPTPAAAVLVWWWRPEDRVAARGTPPNRPKNPPPAPGDHLPAHGVNDPPSPQGGPRPGGAQHHQPEGDPRICVSTSPWARADPRRNTPMNFWSWAQKTRSPPPRETQAEQLGGQGQRRVSRCHRPGQPRSRQDQPQQHPTPPLPADAAKAPGQRRPGQ